MAEGERTPLIQIPLPRPFGRKPAPAAGEEIRGQSLVAPEDIGPAHPEAGRVDGKRVSIVTTAANVWRGGGTSAIGHLSKLAEHVAADGRTLAEISAEAYVPLSLLERDAELTESQRLAVASVLGADPNAVWPLDSTDVPDAPAPPAKPIISAPVSHPLPAPMNRVEAEERRENVEYEQLGRELAAAEKSLELLSIRQAAEKLAKRARRRR